MVLHWLFSCCTQLEKKLRTHGFSFPSSYTTPPPKQPRLPCLQQPVVHNYPQVNKCSCVGREQHTVLLSDIQGTLVRSQTLFPYFMLVAFEAGSILRAFFLLLLYPLLLLFVNVNADVGVRLMTFVTFCGLNVKNMEIVSRGVLPKFFLEDLNVYSYRIMSSAGRRVVFTSSMPRVMVETFLKNYLSVDLVVGSELQVLGGSEGRRFFSGFSRTVRVSCCDFRSPEIVLCNSSSMNPLIKVGKEVYVVTKESATKVMRRENYPKPLVFHDGRLAFLPTPAAALGLFMWIPFGVMLAFVRIVVGTCVPYSIGDVLSAWTGFTIHVKGLRNLRGNRRRRTREGKGGVLYVCSHRTLMDPVVVSVVLKTPITAVTYSLSRLSELISPIRYFII